MKILNLSSTDYGGAGLIAIQYSNLLKSLGHESIVIVKDKKSDSDTIVYKRTLLNKINAFLFRIIFSRIDFDENYYIYNRYEGISTVNAKKLLKLCPFNPDIIILYWVSDFINLKLAKKISKITGARLIWHMTDNSPLTGGCHYPWNCKGYLQDCFSCPATTSNLGKKIIRNNFQQKKKFIPDDITLLTFSEHDYLHAKSSKLFKDKRIIKHLGFVDDKKFKPIEKKKAKEFWGVEPSSKVIFLGASNFNDKRKGFKYAIEAIRLLNNKELVILVAGNYNIQNLHIESKIIHLGFLNENQLILAFQAADLFLSSSIEESGPMMINQAIMCGTPVVSFNIGIARDLVIPNLTGYIARLEDVRDLSNGINTILNLTNEEYLHISHNCRSYALESISEAKAKENYMLLLSTLI